ncbi:MarR family transcriptional regulator [Pseudonocardia kujensis]|uniref:MarR family winged helix-turn-helix transcriptional regulator n=1 Tax=Pseudonocardia kujensis TaxID=1128675 RepID=UPI001E450FDA|nr:MarR family transcriptional regulator [Pseudonocardia kujensis]MCE0767788.1 MarR family transcriptional regulator [Pseudonocardia kujensis]
MSNADDLAGLATAVRETAGLVIRRVRYESGSSLTWSQSALLSDLSRRGEATASQLADDQGLRAQTVWANLETLEKRGLVARERDANDRRHVRARLTDLGRQELEADRKVRDAWIVSVLADEFTTDERTTLSAALGLLTRLAESNLANRPRRTGPA